MKNKTLGIIFLLTLGAFILGIIDTIKISEEGILITGCAIYVIAFIMGFRARKNEQTKFVGNYTVWLSAITLASSFIFPDTALVAVLAVIMLVFSSVCAYQLIKSENDIINY
jgi:hypothetical protein